MPSKKRFKLITLLGIRPDIIRMFKLIKMLDENQKRYGYEHVFAHTGQHFDYELDGVFYKELGVRKPDINLGVGKTLKEEGRPTGYPYQTALLFERVAELVAKERPDAVMYLGDTNSVVSSLMVARAGVPVIHLEAGGRSFDWRMPEEKCRITIDHLSDALYCYVPRYREILLQEGIPAYRIKVIGNIIHDAIDAFLPRAEKISVLEELKLKKGSYALVTLHREENTSTKDAFVPRALDLIKLAKRMPVVWPLMPKTSMALKKFRLTRALDRSAVIQTKPLGFLPFLKLERYAKLTITDSGTVQEESLILGVPCLTSRLSTERPETIAAGATILANDNLYDNALRAMKLPCKWDRHVLNPTRRSPSEAVFNDLVGKIKSGFFKTSRMFEVIGDNPWVQQAYGKMLNV